MAKDKFRSPASLELGLPGFAYADLHDPRGLARLTGAFLEAVRADDPSLAAAWEDYRARRGEGMAPEAVSALLVRMAAPLGRFLARLFRIEAEWEAMVRATRALDPVFAFKRDFVRHRVWSLPDAPSPVPLPDAEARPASALRESMRAGAGEAVTEEALAAHTLQLLRDAGGAASGPAASALEDVARFCRAKAREGGAGWVSLRRPHELHYPAGLVPFERPRERDLPELLAAPAASLRRRDGFGLTDPRMTLKEVLDQTHYCIVCHERGKDSCAKGLPLPRKGRPVQANPLGIPLHGCPLEERISEAHLLKRGGDSIAALAVVMIDNPLCPGTGHRICNDCMKACIYQKQEPVDIPQIETRILVDVLDLPYGFEIYSLLTRWNPLDVRRPHALPYNGIDVLVVGLGPAGYALALHLLNEGFGVVGIDGLKIEPLPADLVGDEARAPRPVRDIAELRRPLDARSPAGFGGVAEYGITVRWDKNFLTVIHLALARRRRFRAYGGVRFGGALTVDDAWALGFRHVSVAAGAGKPTVIPMKNNLLRGIRKASDFLMALQLTGAFRRDALANLQVELPALVIGGGLTAIDAATELLAYYPVQVERTLERYEAAAAARGEADARAAFDEEERRILDRFLEHGRAVRAERERAKRAGEPPNFRPLLDAWGGVTLVYRRGLVDSPAYRLNHEEVGKCLEEGVRFAERLNPVEAVPDPNGHVRAVRFERRGEGPPPPTPRPAGAAEVLELPARCVCVAAGTSPNIIYEREHPGTFEVDAKKNCFRGYRLGRDERGEPRLEPAAQTPEDPGFFTSYARDGRFITYFGDNHPVYAGSVVKAMASARRGFRDIAGCFRDELEALNPARQEERESAWGATARRLDDALRARVVEVRRLTPTVVEVVVRAPLQAKEFRPGQFFRLQNYEAHAPRAGGVPLLMEGIALTGAWVNPGRGHVGLILLEIGASSRLCRLLRPGEEVVLMGPTGTPTEIPAGQNVVLAGGGLGNAVLFSIAKALRGRFNRVVYFAGYRKAGDVFHREDIEESSDQVVWSVDDGERVPAGRPHDLSFRGNIVQAMAAYATGHLGQPIFPFSKVDRMIAIGSDRMMAAVCRARRETLAPFLNAGHVAIASVNSPMQCMMKEVCGQCLQRHVDSASGRPAAPVFSCFNQDQPMDAVDWENLSQRLRQNTVQEKLTNLWLDELLRRRGSELQLATSGGLEIGSFGALPPPPDAPGWGVR